MHLINNGTSFADAMHQSFPDLETYNSELFNYAGSARFNVVRLPFRTIDVGQIATRTLRPAEQALIEDEIKLSQGYPAREAVEFANRIRGIASRFPDDPFAVRMIMETQYLAGDNAAALAAADRLLTIEPNNARALATKGLIQAAGLHAANSTDAAQWTAARQFLVRAVNAAQNDPVVLEAYYRSFVIQGVSPPEDAQSALYSAMELAPSDDEIRYELALDFEHRHMIPEAIAIIRPEAYQVPDRSHESEGQKRERERAEQRKPPRRHADPRKPVRNADQAAGRAQPARPAAPARGGSLGLTAFALQEPGLALEAIGIAAERAARADDPVAGDEHGDIVGAIGRARRAHRRRPPDRGGDLSVGPVSPAGIRCSSRHTASWKAVPWTSSGRLCGFSGAFTAATVRRTSSAISGPPRATIAFGKRRFSAASSSSKERRQMPLSVAATSIVPRSVSAVVQRIVSPRPPSRQARASCRAFCRRRHRNARGPSNRRRKSHR